MSTYDAVGLLNEPDATDFGLLGSLASKHDMIVLILDDLEEFAVPSHQTPSWLVKEKVMEKHARDGLTPGRSAAILGAKMSQCSSDVTFWARI